MSAHFFVGTLFAMIKWWFDNDMPLSPEEMAHLLGRFRSRSAVDVLGAWDQTELSAGRP